MIPFTHHDDQDDDRIQPVLPAAGGQGHPRRPQQHQNHGVLQLSQNPPQQPLLPGGLQLIGAVPPQALLRLMGESPRVCVQLLEKLGPPSHCASGSYHHAPSVFFHYTEGPVRILGKSGRANPFP